MILESSSMILAEGYPAHPKWLDYLDRNPDMDATPEVAVLDDDMWDKLEEINLFVNLAPFINDVEDYWDDVPDGDCDNKTLAKRKLLFQAGFPLGALQPVLCQLPQVTYGSPGDHHMVLRVVTTQGDYILDNVIPFVIPWTEFPYTWLYCWQGEKWKRIATK